MKKKSKFKIKLLKGVAGVLIVCTIIVPQAGSDTYIQTQSTVDINELEKLIQSNKFGILINKNNPITKDQIRNIDLVQTIDINGEKVLLQKDALEAFNAMKAALKKDGYYIDINTGFRTYEEQEAIYNEIVKTQGQAYADKYVAPVGYSEHHTGLAIDVYIDRNKIAEHDIPLQINPQYHKTKNKLYNTMADYGFILRYPEGKEKITGYPQEAWHIRYVGVEVAKFITEKNFTLEEYVEFLNQYEAITENETEIER